MKVSDEIYLLALAPWASTLVEMITWLRGPRNFAFYVYSLVEVILGY